MRSATVLGFAATAIAAPSLMERDSNCLSTAQGTFEIAVVQLAGKRSVEARDATPLTITLKDGALTDAKGRVGNIVANQQFQFDPAPGQPKAITTGFSICTESGVQFLAREGGNTSWERCLSGGFYNLYSTNGAEQCQNIKLQVVPVSGSVGQAGDGQVTQIPDGQIQATGAVTQIGDGQVQAPTGVVPVVTQIGDGQLQAPTGVVTQIGDGQVQAPTGVVTQIGDGQVQAPTGVVTQIGDGQVQAPTGAVSTPIATPPPTAAGSHIIPGSFALALAAVGVVAAL